MSATNAPQGFIPVYHPSGQIVANLYEPTVATNAAIYKGDPVVLTGATSVCTIAVGSGGSPGLVSGVFAGCEYINADGKPVYSPYWPGSTTGATGIKYWIYDDLNIVYEVQGDGSVANTAIGDSANFTAAAGSTYTGVTASVLQTSSLAGAATAKQFRIIGLGQQVDNAWGDSYTVVRVQIAQNQRFTPVNSI